MSTSEYKPWPDEERVAGHSWWPTMIAAGLTGGVLIGLLLRLLH